MKLSEKNTKILVNLFEDCRQSYTQLAKKCGLSKESVAYRIESMQKQGTIQGFTSVLNTQSLGKQLFRILISGNVTYNLEKLKLLGQIAWLAELSGGKWTLTIAYYCNSANEFYDMLGNIFSEINNIEEYKLMEVLGVEYYFPKFFSKDVQGFKTKPAKNNFHLSQTELKVAKQLIKDSRQSVLKIAEESDLSATATTYIIKKLFKQSTLLRSVPIIDYSKLGYDHYKVFIYLENPQELIKMQELIKLNLGLVYVTHVLGDHNLECEILAKQLREITDFLDQIKMEVSIKRYEIILTKKVILNSEGI